MVFLFGHWHIFYHGRSNAHFHRLVLKAATVGAPIPKITSQLLIEML